MTLTAIAWLALNLRNQASNAELADYRCRITFKGTKHTVSVIATLNTVTEATVFLQGKLVNAESSSPVPGNFLVRGEGPHTIVVFTAKNPSSPMELVVSGSCAIGLPISSAIKPYCYSLPFRNVTSLISQGPHGGFSHQLGSLSQEAVDFEMPEGTTICAARGGQVIATRSDSLVGGPDSNYINESNYVIVRQVDHTYASYGHCKYKGVIVKLGQWVREGDPIALSGNTGYSTGPHLHFEVYTVVSGQKIVTLPIMFKSSDGHLIKPVAGIYCQGARSVTAGTSLVPGWLPWPIVIPIHG